MWNVKVDEGVDSEKTRLLWLSRKAQYIEKSSQLCFDSLQRQSRERVFLSEKRVSRVGACVRECGVSALREGDEREGDDDGALSAAPR